MNYIPYSTRHNITDPDLAGLLDYLDSFHERKNKLEFNQQEESIEINLLNKYSSLRIIIDDEVNIMYDYPLTDFGSYFEPFQYMDKELFFVIYKNIIPAIIDLYSK